MKFLAYLFAATSLTFFAAGCKKDSKPVQEKILGKWHLQTLTYRVVEGTDVNEETHDHSQSGDYFDFWTNGIMEIQEDGSAYSVAYQLTDNHTLKVDGLILTIKQLTQNELKLYRKIDDENGYYEEWFYNFKL